MSPELFESIGAQLEQTNRLVHSLYDSGDLSVDQYDAIVHGLSGAALLRKEVARLHTALAWYADVMNYDHAGAPGVLDPQQGEWHHDAGARARAALKEARET